MSSVQRGIANYDERRLPAPPAFSAAELATLDEPQKLLDEPLPHSKLGQQIRRLEQLGQHKVASAVKACGRVGEKWSYECGRSLVYQIIRAHRRFCCEWCDRYVAARLLQEHHAYRERLLGAGTLYRFTAKSHQLSLSAEEIRKFEDAMVKAVRKWLKGYQGWGFKSFTHYENGPLVAKGMIYLPPGSSLPESRLTVPLAVCAVGPGVSVHAYEALLVDILAPTVTEGHGLLRAELMAAFHGGNHLRSLGVLYGLVSKTRRERREKLHLTENQNKESGAGSDQTHKRSDPPAPTCPHCGSSCKRISVTYEPLTELRHLPRVPEASLASIWSEMRLLLRRRYLF